MISDLARAIHDAELAPEEFDRRLARTRASREQGAEVEELIAWFCRRYPSVRERLAYVRRKAAEWQRR